MRIKLLPKHLKAFVLGQIESAKHIAAGSECSIVAVLPLNCRIYLSGISTRTHHSLVAANMNAVAATRRLHRWYV